MWGKLINTEKVKIIEKLVLWKLYTYLLKMINMFVFVKVYAL